MSEGFFSIGFQPEAGETVEAFIDKLKGYVVEVITWEGSVPGLTGRGEYIVEGWAEWDGHRGMPVRVRGCDETHAPVGDPFVLDAKKIIVY